jgi:glyoxylase-like metal-dependent hydrolase (beta-lactamase superfamily II)
LPRFAYTRGLQEVADGAYAWLQPDGSWGWSNAGLIVDGGESLLVDTLFDLKLTSEMLDAMKRAEPAAASIGTLVNTHSNGDHTYGNELVVGAEIVASAATAAEMEQETPEVLAGFKRAAAELGPAGEFFLEKFGPFDFEGITPTLPTTTFEGRVERKVGDKRVELIEVGPAHTGGDVLVYSPSDRTVFTGDILFIDGTPIMWQGPVENWIRACELIQQLDVETVVPGHGPISDKRGAAAVGNYLAYVRDEARKRYDAGMAAVDAARDIGLAEYSAWGDAERIAVNVATLYREFSGGEAVPVPELFGLMAELARDRAGG